MCIFKNINLKLFKLIASNFDCCRHWQVVLGSTLLEKETLFPYLAKIRKKLPKYTECFFCTLSGKLKTTLIKIIPVESQVKYI